MITMIDLYARISFFHYSVFFRNIVDFYYFLLFIAYDTYDI